MQNQDSSQKPVQLDANYHQALKEWSVHSGQSMGSLVALCWLRDKEFRDTLAEVKKGTA